MIKLVHLHGYLRDLVGHKTVEVNAETVKEAIEMLCAVTGKALAPNAREGRRAMQILGFDTKESLTEKTDVEEYHIVPPFAAGKSKFLQIIVGVALVAVSFWNPIGGIVLFGTGASATTLGSVLFGIGLSMVLGGVLQLLMPQPKIDNGTNVDNSKYLGAPGNTVRIGTRRPIGFGTYRVYGHFLSYNVSSEEFSYGNGPPPAHPLFGPIWSGILNGSGGGTRYWWEAN